MVVKVILGLTWFPEVCHAISSMKKRALNDKRERLPMVEVSREVYGQLKDISATRGYKLKRLVDRLLTDALKRKIA